MGRTAEAALVALFAAGIAVPATVVFTYVAIGPQKSGTHVDIMLALSLAGVASAFVAARLILRGSNLTTYRAGLVLGLWAAFGFYIVWIVIFAGIPALVATYDGRFAEGAGYFAEFTWIVLLASRGLPVAAGVCGGLGYVALKRRLARRAMR